MELIMLTILVVLVGFDVFLKLIELVQNKKLDQKMNILVESLDGPDAERPMVFRELLEKIKAEIIAGHRHTAAVVNANHNVAVKKIEETSKEAQQQLATINAFQSDTFGAVQENVTVVAEALAALKKHAKKR